MFFVPCDNLEDVIFSKSLLLPWYFLNRHNVIFFETSVLEEVRILRYLHNNSALLILMPSSKIKLSCTADLKKFRWLFYNKVLHILYFMTVPRFSL